MAQVTKTDDFYKTNFSCLEHFVATVCFTSLRYIKVKPLVSKSKGLVSNNHAPHVPVHQ